MNEKNNQTNAEELKRKHAKENKAKIDDTMLAFSTSILPAAEGCHPSITIGPRSNKMDRFNGYNPLQIERGTGDDKNDGDNDSDDDDEDEDEDDDVKEHNEKASAESKRPRYVVAVDEDGTRRYKTDDAMKEISYRKNAPQNGKY